MPYENEHSARVRDPGDFEPGSFRRKNITRGVDLILGRLKGKTTMTAQAYRFDKSVFTVAEAKEWLKEHKVEYISFEPASKSLIQEFFEKLKL
jgi:hypothetical protein